ncbi:MAG: hypothetical protein SGI87_14125 [Flavobacteriales bacterium]|nr:hypothetical protein [Flavobacteriales bacterium]
MRIILFGIGLSSLWMAAAVQPYFVTFLVTTIEALEPFKTPELNETCIDGGADVHQ